MSVLEWLQTKYSGYEHRYTDGSLSQVGVGIGIIGHSLEISKSLQPWYSIFSAEAVAVFIAATTVSVRPILVLTDSASVISALQSDTPQHPWIQGIIKNSPHSTVFAWIPGHCGIPGNVAADRLAGIGHAERRYSSTAPLDDVKRHIRKKFRDHWNVEWASSHSSYIRKIKQDTSAWDDRKSLREQRVVSRLRTGHTRLSHNFDGADFNVICSTCNVRNTVEHFLCVCPQYEFSRQTYGLSSSIREILSDDASATTSLICFLKDAGLFYRI